MTQRTDNCEIIGWLFGLQERAVNDMLNKYPSTPFEPLPQYVENALDEIMTIMDSAIERVPIYNNVKY